MYAQSIASTLLDCVMRVLLFFFLILISGQKLKKSAALDILMKSNLDNNNHSIFRPRLTWIARNAKIDLLTPETMKKLKKKLRRSFTLQEKKTPLLEFIMTNQKWQWQRNIDVCARIISVQNRDRNSVLFPIFFS